MAKRKRKRNGLVRDVTRFGAAGVGLSAFSAGISRIPGSVASGVGAGFTTASRGFSSLGSLIVVREVVRQTRRTRKNIRKRVRGISRNVRRGM